MVSNLINLSCILGKDDKYWGGHYGVIMSNAIVRVRREAKSAPADAFVDIIEVKLMLNSLI